MKQIGRILLRIAGLLLIMAGLVLAWFNRQEAQTAASFSEHISQKLEQETIKEPVRSENGEMPIETVDGVDFIGTIHIPSLDLTLPIAAQYTYQQLSQTPTRYSGSYHTNDLVVCAHNYSTHFDPLRSIALGEEIVLTTVTGQTYHYRITNRQIIEPTAVDQVFKDTASDTDWDLSLFTCTPSGLARVLVRCSRIE